MAKADIWMPLYIGDYLADTMGLNTEQHGAYLLLLMAYWKNGGALPSDDITLSTITRLSVDAWSMHKHRLASYFDVDSDPELWIHVRAEKEMNKAGNNQEKRTLRAQAAAAARWNKNAPSNATSNPQAMLNECPSPSPSPIKIKIKNTCAQDPIERSKNITASDLALLGVDEQHARDWMAIRKLKKAPLTPTALIGVQREAERAGVTLADAIQIAAERGWQGFKADWLEKDNGFGKTNTGTSGKSRPSLVDQVRAANAHHLIDEPPPIDPRDWPEFDRIREIDGTLVGADD